MPLNRHQIRNEYSLADPDLYKVADKDDPEALLEGVAMAGLVGVLRQLGDLAEFAAEIFHELHEEVMATAARGHDLIVRVQQVEAEFPSIERTLLSQTKHTAFLYNSGVDWHPNLRMDNNLVTQGDLPRFVMDSYEECRGPPRLFLLDKFDVAGAGACLKRFTDPSFFKTEATLSTGRKPEGQRDKKTRRVKKRGPRWRNGDTPEPFPSSHAKLHQLFLEERIESGSNDPECRVKLKKKQFTGSMFDQDNGKSYMEKFLDTCVPEQKIVHEIYVDPLPLTWTSNDACESGLEIVEIGTISPLKESTQTDKSLCLSPDTGEMVVKPSMDDQIEGKLDLISDSRSGDVPGLNHGSRDVNTSVVPKVVIVEEFSDKANKSEVNVDDACNSDGFASEIDSYKDALANVESEVETDSEYKNNPKFLNLKPIVADSVGSEEQRELQSEFFDSSSVGNSATSEDGNNSYKERESSTSNSVNTLVKTTPDCDAVDVAVISLLTSNSYPDNVSIDLHSTFEKILGKETEEHCVAGTQDIEVDEIPKNREEFGEASNTSFLIDSDTKVLPVDAEASLMESSFPIPELDEVYSDSAEHDVSEERGQKHASKTATWQFSETIPDVPEGTDSGHCSSVEHPIHEKAGDYSTVTCDTLPAQPNSGLVGLLKVEFEKAFSVSSLVAEHIKDLGTADVDTCLDIGPTTEHQPASGPENPEKVKPLHVAPEEDMCIRLTEEKSNDQHSASDSTQILDIQEQLARTMNLGRISFDTTAGDLPYSREDTSIKEVLNTADSEERASSIPLVGQAEIFPAISNGLQTCSQEFSSPGITEAAEIAEFGFFEAVVGGDDTVRHDSTTIFSDGTKAVTTNTHFDDPETQAVPVEACHDHAPDKKHCNMKKTSFHVASHFNIPSQHAIDSNLVLAADNDSDLDHDLGKVESVETVHNGSKQVDVKDDHHQNVIPLSSSSMLLPGKLLEPPLSVIEDSHQNEEELAKGYRAELTEKRHTDPVQDALVNSNSNMCYMSSDGSPSLILLDDSLVEDADNSGKLVDKAPLASENSSSHYVPSTSSNQIHLPEAKDEVDSLDCHLLKPEYVDREGCLNDTEGTPESSMKAMVELSEVFPVKGMLTGVADHASQKKSSERPAYPSGFPAVGVLPAEPRVNLEAPPLPPLPPMQWRLGRLQNSSAAPEKQMVQHTPPPIQVQPITQPTIHHTLGPSQQITLAAVHSSLASIQPVTLSAVHDTLAPIVPMTLPTVPYTVSPVQPMTLPTNNYETETIAQTSKSQVQPGYSDGFAATVSKVYSQNNTSGVGRPDNLPSAVPSTSTKPQNSIQMSEGSYQLNVSPPESGSFIEGHASEHDHAVVKAKENPETGIQNELLTRIPQVTEEEVDKSVVDQPPPGFVTPEAGVTWSSTYDIVPTHADGNANGTLQKKPPRPRNPLIDEVVAIDKSKLRKVERVKAPLEVKAEEGESLLEQLQLRKVGKRIKPPVEPKAEERNFLPEHMQLRKVGERVKQEAEQRPEETASPRLQLRKVGETVKQEAELKAEETESPRMQLSKVGEKEHPLVRQKTEERDSLFAQIRNKSFNLKPAVSARPKIQGAITNLKVAAILEKASTIRQAMAGSDEDDDVDTWSDC